MSDPISTSATAVHIRAVVAKRDMLTVTAAQSLDVLLAEVARGTWSPLECVDWWEFSRTLGIPHASNRMIAALKVTVHQISQWRADPRLAQFDLRRCDGVFPVPPRVYLPSKPTPVVYLLLNEAGYCLYVGKTISARSRLKAHAKAGVIPATRFEAHVCDTEAEALRVEGDLIYQHKPFYNRQGVRTRRYVA